MSYEIRGSLLGSLIDFERLFFNQFKQKEMIMRKDSHLALKCCSQIPQAKLKELDPKIRTTRSASIFVI